MPLSRLNKGNGERRGGTKDAKFSTNVRSTQARRSNDFVIERSSELLITIKEPWLKPVQIFR
jgi:hypothetical protein